MKLFHAGQKVPLFLEQTPVAGLHVPATWHWSEGVHTTGFAPVQTPTWHVSGCVHSEQYGPDGSESLVGCRPKPTRV